MDLARVTPDLVSPENPDEGDLFVGADGDLRQTVGAEAEGQAIEAGLRTGQGEWFLDLAAGVAYRALLGVKGISAVDVQAAVAAEILRRGTVAAITKLSVAIAPDRAASVAWEATLEDGTTLNGTAPIGPA